MFGIPCPATVRPAGTRGCRRELNRASYQALHIKVMSCVAADSCEEFATTRPPASHDGVVADTLSLDPQATGIALSRDTTVISPSTGVKSVKFPDSCL